jgi:hypothetical protein
MQQGIDVRTLGRFALLKQPGAQHIHARPEPSHQTIKGFQGKNRSERLGSSFDGAALLQLAEQLPQQGGPDTVPRQNIGQKDRESPSATAALPAIGTEYPLPPAEQTVGLGGIVAVKNAMPV